MEKFVLRSLFLGLVCLSLVCVAAEQPPAAAEDCGCETAALPDVVLVLNGTKYKQADVIPNHVSSQIQKLHQSVVDARRNELGLIINSRLLAAEAKKRGLPKAVLIEEEVLKKVAEPTEAEAQAFYDKNRAQIVQDFASVKTQIVEFLRSERQRAGAQAFAQRLRAAADVKMLAEFATPPKSPADRGRVLAQINGEPIRSGDVEDNLRGLIFATQEDVYRLRKDQIDLKVNDTLLAGEAQKRGVTTQALLEAEVSSKLATVTDAEAQTFYNENKSRIGGEFANLKPQIVQYLGEQRKNAALAAFAERLRKAATIQVLLPVPVPPAYEIDIAGRPLKGSPAAPVTLVEFIDMQCRTCAVTQAAVYRLVEEYKGRIRLAALHFPLSQHQYAAKAAEAVEAAGEQGKFWEYVDLLLSDQSALSTDDLKKQAGRLGIDRQKFDAALADGRYADRVEKHQFDGSAMGVSGTPYFFVNGVRVAGSTYEALKSAIEDALKNPRR